MLPKNLLKLQEKSRLHTATVHNGNAVTVASLGNARITFFVTLDYQDEQVIHPRCTCPWARHGGVACSHVMAALEKLAETQGRCVSFWLTREDAEKQHERVWQIGGKAEESLWMTSRATEAPPETPVVTEIAQS